eukprot:NODE_6133_length_529_cov_25.375000_g5373_i0.p2 GENE.NODE_6133_length_529_cov_25.375000_g5373_i0~~NODE_6133_length_529_cov_25.375000_g5373_i0.p2  ORF type:complete len:95 (-),score=12.65 NODE_6133_length_529_cov_25.375000_g5373_i0:216-500(-)
MGAVTTSLVTGLIAGLWTMSLRIAICVGFSQVIAMTIAGITGTAAPMIFGLMLNRDPGVWAGPLETAMQDLFSSVFLFYSSLALLAYVLPQYWP